MTDKKKTIRFMHIADTHNGYNGNASLHNEFSELKVNKFDITGENIRTADVNKAFAQAIDIAIEEDVDFVAHAGDGMNHYGYSQPKHFNFYMKEVDRFVKTGKQWVEVAGNHNFAKKAGVGNELEKLSLLPNVRTAYRGRYEVYEVPNTNVVCHLLPSSLNPEMFKEELAKVERVEGKFNLMIAHCGVSSIPQYAENESSIVVHLDELVSKKMDYVALGDYHYFVDLGNNIIYPGPIEHLAFGQEKNPRVLIVDIDPDTNEVTINHRFLKVRPMIDLKTIDAKDMKLEDIQTQIVKQLSNAEIEEAIVRQRITNLPRNLKNKHLFLTDEIKELIDKCLYFKFDFKNKIELTKDVRTKDLEEEIVFESLQLGLANFITQMPENPDFKKPEIIRFANKYLMEALEDEIS